MRRSARRADLLGISTSSGAAGRLAQPRGRHCLAARTLSEMLYDESHTARCGATVRAE